MNNDTLKPCPFHEVLDLTGVHGVTGLTVLFNPDDGDYQVECQDCYARGPSVSPESAAIKLWNSRAKGTT